MWLILRTDHAKEGFVSRQATRLGLEAWVPAQIIICRPVIARRVPSKSHLRAYKEIPILPRRVFVTAPNILDREVQSELRTLRHVRGLEDGPDNTPVCIPIAQIAAFRAEIDRENTASLALLETRTRKHKAKWRSLKDALLDVIAEAKGRMEMVA